MATQTFTTTHIRISLVEKILTSIDTRKTKETITELAQAYMPTAELKTDLPLLQSVTLIDFLAKQIHIGNSAFLTPEIIQESYRYILDKLIPNSRPAF